MLIVSLIVLQVLFFMGLILVFRRILNKNVVQATKHIDELNEDYVKKESEAEKRLAEAKQKADELVAKGREEAEKYREKVMKEADAEKDKVLKEARSQSEEMIKQADRSRQQLISELEEKIDKAAADRACVLIQKTLPDRFKMDAHSQWTEELIEGSTFERLKHLQIPADLKEAKITSAFPLNDAQRRNLSKKLKQLLGRDIKVQEKTDPNIVAGIIVAVGSLVLDGSLKNKIQEQAQRDVTNG